MNMVIYIYSVDGIRKINIDCNKLVETVPETSTTQSYSVVGAGRLLVIVASLDLPLVLKVLNK